ncbi:TetR/AcrR family transcriptional regulator [Pelomonas sp. KK5]|uniref:TetR/AcrR family transcriptional regulator n=1 Tax=Pelomonas sp. KK5 TaxID=1855730 RepID=UPI0009FA1135|nr:TetR/AcrR family transcriptional regulator [Pelomonas sp. KK5]
MSTADPMTTPASGKPARPDLEPKRAPLQPRAVETYERILAACAELLGEVGIERLSTNLVCQRAGISPPALYQYFPNKYAILHELSVRLMQQQNKLLMPWASAATMALPEAEFARSLAELFLQMQALTAQMPAGVWVTRAQRAVPALQGQRLRSREVFTEMMMEPFGAAHPEADPARARLTLRLAIDALYAAHEMLFDDASLDPQAVAQTMSEMVAGQLARVCEGR